MFSVKLNILKFDFVTQFINEAIQRPYSRRKGAQTPRPPVSPLIVRNKSIYESYLGKVHHDCLPAKLDINDSSDCLPIYDWNRIQKYIITIKYFLFRQHINPD